MENETYEFNNSIILYFNKKKNSNKIALQLVALKDVTHELKS